MKMLGLACVAACLFASTAYAEVVVIVNPKTPENRVSPQDAATLFLGRKSVLGNGTRVTPIDQEEGSPVRDVFYQKIADRNPGQMKAYWSTMIFTGRATPPPAAADSMEVRNIVASTPGTIGYIDAADVDDSVKVILTLP